MDTKYNKELSIVSGIFLFLLLSFVAYVAFTSLRDSVHPDYGKNITVHIENLPIHLTVAHTEEEKKKGMTDKKNIPWNSGILFVFDEKLSWRVSMDGMKFAIDIFWVDENGQIVYIEHDAQPYKGDIIVPPKPAVYILEMRAGFADVHNIEVGDVVKF